MANVTLPRTVLIAGGALCLLGGFLAGAVLGQDSPTRTTAKVASFDERTSALCLEGDSVDEQEGAKDGELCGTWRREAGQKAPVEGADFSFVSVRTSGELDGKSRQQVVIYGNVVG